MLLMLFTDNISQDPNDDLFVLLINLIKHDACTSEVLEQRDKFHLNILQKECGAEYFAEICRVILETGKASLKLFQSSDGFIDDAILRRLILSGHVDLVCQIIRSDIFSLNFLNYPNDKHTSSFLEEILSLGCYPVFNELAQKEGFSDYLDSIDGEFRSNVYRALLKGLESIDSLEKYQEEERDKSFFVMLKYFSRLDRDYFFFITDLVKENSSLLTLSLLKDLYLYLDSFVDSSEDLWKFTAIEQCIRNLGSNAIQAIWKDNPELLTKLLSMAFEEENRDWISNLISVSSEETFLSLDNENLLLRMLKLKNDSWNAMVIQAMALPSCTSRVLQSEDILGISIKRFILLQDNKELFDALCQKYISDPNFQGTHEELRFQEIRSALLEDQDGSLISFSIQGFSEKHIQEIFSLALAKNSLFICSMLIDQLFQEDRVETVSDLLSLKDMYGNTYFMSLCMQGDLSFISAYSKLDADLIAKILFVEVNDLNETVLLKLLKMTLQPQSTALEQFYLKKIIEIISFETFTEEMYFSTLDIYGKSIWSLALKINDLNLLDVLREKFPNAENNSQIKLLNQEREAPLLAQLKKAMDSGRKGVLEGFPWERFSDTFITSVARYALDTSNLDEFMMSMSLDTTVFSDSVFEEILQMKSEKGDTFFMQSIDEDVNPFVFSSIIHDKRILSDHLCLINAQSETILIKLLRANSEGRFSYLISELLRLPQCTKKLIDTLDKDGCNAVDIAKEILDSTTLMNLSSLDCMKEHKKELESFAQKIEIEKLKNSLALNRECDWNSSVYRVRDFSEDHVREIFNSLVEHRAWHSFIKFLCKGISNNIHTNLLQELLMTRSCEGCSPWVSCFTEYSKVFFVIKFFLQEGLINQDILRLVNNQGETLLMKCFESNIDVSIEALIAIIQSEECTSDILEVKRKDGLTLVNLAQNLQNLSVLNSIQHSPHCQEAMHLEISRWILELDLPLILECIEIFNRTSTFDASKYEFDFIKRLWAYLLEESHETMIVVIYSSFSADALKRAELLKVQTEQGNTLFHRGAELEESPYLSYLFDLQKYDISERENILNIRNCLGETPLLKLFKSNIPCHREQAFFILSLFENPKKILLIEDGQESILITELLKSGDFSLLNRLRSIPFCTKLLEENPTFEALEQLEIDSFIERYYSGSRERTFFQFSDQDNIHFLKSLYRYSLEFGHIHLLKDLLNFMYKASFAKDALESVFAIQNSDGDTCIHLMIEHDLLLMFVAKFSVGVTERILRLKNHKGLTILMKLIEKNMYDYTRIAMAYIRTSRFSDKVLNDKNTQGQTIYHLAQIYGNLDILDAIASTGLPLPSEGVDHVESADFQRIRLKHQKRHKDLEDFEREVFSVNSREHLLDSFYHYIESNDFEKLNILWRRISLYNTFTIEDEVALLLAQPANKANYLMRLIENGKFTYIQHYLKYISVEGLLLENNQGDTALTMILRKNYKELIFPALQIISKMAKEYPNPENNDQLTMVYITAFQEALKNQNILIIEALFSASPEESVLNTLFQGMLLEQSDTVRENLFRLAQEKKCRIIESKLLNGI